MKTKEELDDIVDKIVEYELAAQRATTDAERDQYLCCITKIMLEPDVLSNMDVLDDVILKRLSELNA